MQLVNITGKLLKISGESWLAPSRPANKNAKLKDNCLHENNEITATINPLANSRFLIACLVSITGSILILVQSAFVRQITILILTNYRWLQFFLVVAKTFYDRK